MRFNKLKNITFIFLGSIFLLHSSLDAHVNSVFDGLYAGVEIGYVSSVSKYDRFNPNPTAFPFSVENSFGLEGYDLGAHIGWGKTCFPCFPIYLGLEWAGLYVNSRGKDIFHEITAAPLPPGEQLDFDHRARIHDSYRLALRFGIPIYQLVMPYFKIGYDNAKWKLVSENSAFLNLVTGMRSNQSSRRLSGLLIAIGMDIAICKRTIFGFHFDHTRFSKQTLSLATGTNPEAKTLFKPKYSRIALRVSYLF